MVESSLLTGCWTPCRRYRQALVAAVEEPQHVAAENVTDVLHPADTGTIRLHRPVRHVKGRVHHRQVIFFRRVLKRERREFFFLSPPSQELSFEVSLIIIISCGTYQISFGGDRHQDKIVAHTHLLTLGSLLGGGVHGPPTCLTFENKTLRNSERIVTRYFTRAPRPVKSLPALHATLFQFC